MAWPSQYSKYGFRSAYRSRDSSSVNCCSAMPAMSCPFLHYFNFRGFLLPSEMRSSRLGPGAGKLDKAADRNATGALGEPRLWIIQPGGRGNIQMNPRGRVGELLQEPCRRNGAAVAAADVWQIREHGLEIVLILVVHGELPHLLSRAAGRFQQLIEQRLIVREGPDIVVTKGNGDGAGQRSGVHDVRCAIALCVRESVGENQPTFRIGVQNLNGFSGQRCDD